MTTWSVVTTIFRTDGTILREEPVDEQYTRDPEPASGNEVEFFRSPYRVVIGSAFPDGSTVIDDYTRGLT